MNEEMIEKVRELVRSGDPKDAELALGMLPHMDRDQLLKRRGMFWDTFNDKPKVCEYVKWDKHKNLEIVTAFVELRIVGRNGIEFDEWYIVTERNPKIRIEKIQILDLRKGFWVCQDAKIHLSFWDRIRILFGAKLEVRCEHECSKEVEVSKGTARITVGEPKVRSSQLGAMVGGMHNG